MPHTATESHLEAMAAKCMEAQRAFSCPCLGRALRVDLLRDLQRSQGRHPGIKLVTSSLATGMLPPRGRILVDVFTLTVETPPRGAL